MKVSPGRAAIVSTGIVIGMGLLAAVPLWKAGFLNTRIVGESPYLLMRVQQLWTALSQGVFPVRWMPDAAYGYGYPFFSFYAALPYYVAAFFRFLSFDTVTSLKLTQTLSFLIGAGGTYAWARRHLRSRAGAIAAAAAFTLAPIHMINIYIRGDSLSEFWAMGLYPVILWAADRIIDGAPERRAQAANIALLGLLYGGLMLSHNISALIFSPVLALYIVWRMLPAIRDLRRWIGLASGMGLGLALSAWFWLPALAERSTINAEGFLSGYFDWHNNFLDAGLVQTGLLVDFSQYPFRLGLWQVVLAVLGLVSLVILLLQRRAQHAGESSRSTLTVGAWSLVTFGLAVLMTVSVSAWAYDHVPLLAYLQFPWRWLSVAALAGAGLAALAVEVWPSLKPRVAVASIVVLVSLVTSVASLSPNFIPLTEDQITPPGLNEAEYYSGDIGTTVRADYLPRDVHPRPFSGPAIEGQRTLKVLTGEATGSQIAAGAAWQQWQLQVSGDQAAVAIPTYYWPGWAAWLEDGSRLPTSAVDGIGWIQVQVPGGRHTVTLRLGETPLRFTADALSALAALIWLALISLSVRNRYRRIIPSPAGRDLKIAVGVAVTLLVIRVGSGQVIPAPPTFPQATQFLTASYRHPYEKLSFKDGSALLGYVYTNEQIHPAEKLGIAFQWQSPTPARLELIPPLDNIWGYKAALLSLDVPAGQDNAVLGIPALAAPGMYFVRLSVGDDAYDLAPIRILPASDESVPPGNIDPVTIGDTLQLTTVTAEPLDRGRLNLFLGWRVLKPVTRTYSLSLRLRSPDGIELAKHDAQLGVYGAAPAAFWPATFTDWLTLSGLDGLPPGEGYQLGLALFDGDHLVGSADLRDIAIRQSPRQTASAAIAATLTGSVSVNATEVEQGADLTVTAGWAGPVRAGWQVRWQIVPDAATAGPSLDLTTPLAPGARLDWWQADQQYTAQIPVTIPVTARPGSYRLNWAVTDGSGAPVTASQLVGKISVLPTTRQFAPPTGVPSPQAEPVFGSRIGLWSYQLDQQASQLNIRLTWRAVTRPDRDYTYFVHIQRVDAPTPSAQVDTMPRQNAYPTSHWLAGEFVSDQTTVSLNGLQPGTYAVWLGWYDPTSGTRLALVENASGSAPASDNRYLLGQITIP